MSFPEAGSVSDMRAAVIEALHGTATIIVGVIVAGAAVAVVSFVRSGGSQGWSAAFQQFRSNFGRAILLGLEFLVAADIIGTVAITPSFQSLGVLGLIIAIHTLLSFSLEVEMEGRWPWRRHESRQLRPIEAVADHGPLKRRVASGVHWRHLPTDHAGRPSAIVPSQPVSHGSGQQQAERLERRLLLDPTGGSAHQ